MNTRAAAGQRAGRKPVSRRDIAALHVIFDTADADRRGPSRLRTAYLDSWLTAQLARFDRRTIATAKAERQPNPHTEGGASAAYEMRADLYAETPYAERRRH
jgi:hypothetical protein